MFCCFGPVVLRTLPGFLFALNVRLRRIICKNYFCFFYNPSAVAIAAAGGEKEKKMPFRPRLTAGEV
jgi:hypothetical protein